MAKEKSKRQTPGVVFQPRTYQGMQGGIDKLVAAIRPTLGPVHHNVVIEKESKVGKPEFLDDGAVIARRIIQLPDRDEDMGAMYLRQLLWTLHENAGDGTATAALIFHTIYKEGLKYIANGGNAMRLRENLEKTTPLILNELESMTFTFEGKEQLARLAETICYEPELARMLGEIFDIIGEFGRLEIRTGQGRAMEREYVEGMYWNGGILSREMASNPGLGRAQMEDTAILASDLEIKDPEVVLHILETAIRAEVKSLLLVARTISEQALSILLMKPNREKVRVVAVKAPGLSSDDHRESLEDLTMLTGGRPFFQAAGEGLQTLKASDFGFARRAWADQNYFGISGGKGDPRQLRLHIATLRSAFAKSDDPQCRKRLQERIGKLLGGSAVLWIGHPSPITAQARKELAVRTAEAMRGAMRSGVLPGGGLALLACKPFLLEKYHQVLDSDERAAYRILARAVEAPIRALLQNAGDEPVEILAQIAAAGRGCGYDVVQHKIVNMAEAGIVDSAAVIREAAYRAIHGAALALTVDVLIHRANPPAAYHTT
jgi:chaperonin GroEL